MRNRPLSALGLCAAALLGQVSVTPAEGVQGSRAQASGQQGPQTSGQTARRQNQQTGQPTATRQSQPTGKPAPGQTAKQGSDQKAQAAPPPTIPPGFRLLTLKEGQTIVEEMSWADDEEGLAPDCSHLVHKLYEQAGHSYPYASSLDLYRGTGPFLRVRFAHPGDLVVWQGHVGLVVDPKGHTFFSSVTAGTRMQNYRSAYWQARGYPRFYRYLTKSPLKGGGTSEASNRSPGLPPKEQSVPGSGENRPGLQVVKAAPVLTARAADKSRSDTAAGKPHEEAPPASTARAENPSRTSSATVLQIPLRTAGHAPQAADVTSALQAANLEAGEILRAGTLGRLERPVVVYRQLQVSGVEMKGRRGLARIRVETVAALSAERMESQLGWEDHQLELQLTNKGWVMMQGNEIAYVPRDGAMRILSGRLAALTQSTERSTAKDREREQADIVRFMNLLVE